MNDLIHFSAQPLTSVHDCEPRRGDEYHKPNGLWVSVGEAWAEWCLSENFGLGRLRYFTPVYLAEGANILRFGSEWELRCFTNEYERKLESYHNCIDWPRVMREHDGIIITPYLWSCRHSLNWYYGWDVASGCIWKASAISHLGDSLCIAEKSEVAA